MISTVVYSKKSSGAPGAEVDRKAVVIATAHLDHTLFHFVGDRAWCTPPQLGVIMVQCPWWQPGGGMRRAVVVELTEAQRSQLEGLVRAGGTPQRTVRRARVVLLASRGEQNKAIARQVGMTQRGVGRWRRRFVEKGVEGLLKDLPGRGRTPTLTAERIAGIVASTTEKLPPGRTQWSRSTMANASGLSESTIGRIWRSHGLKPHRVEAFKLSNDPRFAGKLEDIVGLHLNPPENAVVFSADEKSQIQALDRTQPGLPIKKGRAGTMTHDYKRHGTTTLFAALNVLTGVVTGRCKARHTHAEWLAFLKTLERQVPKYKAVHVVCDNYATHKHPAVREWLADHPRLAGSAGPR
ncbi:MAG: IS630 family transposase [Deltaproteobacteria bacterium]|nr:IS630 family transposase [Deltaproteobacteria bacterium]